MTRGLRPGFRRAEPTRDSNQNDEFNGFFDAVAARSPTESSPRLGAANFFHVKLFSRASHD
jgi:hypothetical protein